MQPKNTPARLATSTDPVSPLGVMGGAGQPAGLKATGQSAVSSPKGASFPLGRALAFPREYWSDVLALASYLPVVGLFFWQIVAGAAPLGYDLLAFFYPYKAYVAELLAKGELPLWNPRIFMGAPLLANIQSAILYPPNLLFYLLPTVDALRLSTLLHVFLGAGFTYLFARMSLGLGLAGSWAAGTIFAFGGFMGAHVGHLNQLHAAVWLPLLLLSLERASALPSLRFAGFGAFVLAIQVMAGHTQEVYYSIWAVGLFAIYLALLHGPQPRRRLVPFAALLLMVAGAAALGAIQLLPSWELASQSYRSGGIPLAEAVGYSVPLNQVLDTLLPLFWWAPYVEIVGYTGMVSFVLLPASMAFGRKWGAQWFFAGLGLLALLLSLGGATPLYGWLHHLAPGFDLFRAPGRWLFLYSFSVAVLAGMGLNSLEVRLTDRGLVEGMGRYGFGLLLGAAVPVGLVVWMTSSGMELDLPHPRVLFACGLLLLLGASGFVVLRARFRGPSAGLALACLILLELFLAREPLEYNRPVEPSLYTLARPSHAALTDDSPYRAFLLAGEQLDLADEADLRSRLPGAGIASPVEDYMRFTRIKEAASPNAGMVFGFKSLDGYDGGLLPTRRYAEFKNRLAGAEEHRADLTLRRQLLDVQPVAVPHSQLLGVLGVRYLLAGEEVKSYDPGWQEIAAYHGGALRLLRNGEALPRAQVVHEFEAAPTADEALAMVFGEDLRSTVILEEPVEYSSPLEAGKDSYSIVNDGANRVELALDLEQPGFLVLSDSYYPGWKAYVDGRETRLLRANYAVRAVQVDAGSHRVLFSFEPLSFQVGALVSATAMIALLALFALPRRFASVLHLH